MHTTHTKIRAAGYVRVSREEQVRYGLSLQAQEQRLRDFANERGYELVKIYRDEGVTARKPMKKRKGLTQLLEDAEKGEFSIILFWKLDRFFRSVKDYYAAMAILEEHGVDWMTTDEDYDTSTSAGRLLLNMRVSISEMESDQTSERIRLTMKYRVNKGLPLSGSLPFGLSIRIVDGNKRVVPDPEKAPVVRAIFAHFILHQNKKAAMMYAREKFGINISYTTVTTLLRSPLICGRYRDNNHYCEPIIPPADFDRVQDILSRNVKASPSGRVYLFSGLLRCPECGRRLSANYRTARDKDRVVVREYIHYRCNGSIKYATCSWRRSVNESKIEAELINSLGDIIHSHLASVSVVPDPSSHVDHAERIKSLHDERNRLNTMYRKGRITEKVYDRDYDRITAEITALENEPSVAANTADLEELLRSDWLTVYNHLDREHKRGFWRRLFSSVRVDECGHLVDCDVTNS